MYTVYIYIHILIYLYMSTYCVISYSFSSFSWRPLGIAPSVWRAQVETDLAAHLSGGWVIYHLSSTSIPTVVLYIWRQRLVQFFLTLHKPCDVCHNFSHLRITYSYNLWIPSQLGLWMAWILAESPTHFTQRRTQRRTHRRGAADLRLWWQFWDGDGFGWALRSQESSMGISPGPWRRGRSKKGMGMTWDINRDILMGYTCVYIYNKYNIIYIYYCII